MSDRTRSALEDARALLRRGDDAAALALLQGCATRQGDDPALLHLMAQALTRLGRLDEAVEALRSCASLAPGDLAVRYDLAYLLMRVGQVRAARDEAIRILDQAPDSEGTKLLLAAIQHAAGDDAEAADTYEGVLAKHPDKAGAWIDYGHVLRTLGRPQEAARAYRRSMMLAPSRGDAYWGLANLKVVPFTDAEIAALEMRVLQPDAPAADRVNMLFALGRALEERGDAAGAFSRYAEGAALRRSITPYDAAALTASVQHWRQLFSADFFDARSGAGCPDASAIFVVGLPRSGSTLVEQILAAHSAVEAVGELVYLHDLAQRLGAPQFEALAALDATGLAGAGASYLHDVRQRRKADLPRFIDKSPMNWAYVGLIRVALPNAKIIDVRRHPMACGWSCFKQHFPLSQNFTYSLADLGLYYRDYVRLMAHFDAVLPGRVHRIVFEDLVTNTEQEVRALLSFCELPFEEGCLHPHRSSGPVRTASASQVRQPIYRTSMEAWLAYKAWLSPLETALGDVLRTWRGQAIAPDRDS